MRRCYWLITAVTLVMTAPFISLSDGRVDADSSILKEMPGEGNDISLTGLLDIEEAAGTRIIGPYIDPPGGHLGKMTSLIRTDTGYDIQFLIEDPDAPGSPYSSNQYKRLYEINGDDGRFPEIVDIDDDTPFEWAYYMDNSYSPSSGYDIDGNGFNDSVTVNKNYPDLSDPNRPGILRIEFRSENLARVCSYTGVDARDALGSCLVIEDLNEDGRDDIIVGASGADGSGNSRPECGEIHVIYGADNRSFPGSGTIEDVSDHVIEGALVEGSGYEDYLGDRIGTCFSIKDLERDGNLELIVSNYMGWKIGDTGRLLRNTGWVSVFDLDPIIPWKGSRIILSHPSGRLTITGQDEGDMLGWSIKYPDLDLDGFTDLFISSHSADGINNDKPRCGEVYIVYGSGIRLTGLKVEGTGVEGKKVFCRSGTSRWQLSFMDTVEGGSIERLEMDLIKGDTKIGFTFFEGSNVSANVSPTDHIILSSGFQKVSEYHYSYQMELYLNWSFPLKGPVDIRISIIDDSGRITESLMKKRMEICKDVEIVGNMEITADNISLEETGGHALPGSSIQINGVKVSYKDSDSLVVDPNSLRIELAANDEIRSSFMNGNNNSLSTVARDIVRDDMIIRVVYLGLGKFEKNHPEEVKPVSVSIPVDTKAPSKPVVTRSEIIPYWTGDDKTYNMTLEWDDEIGIVGDIGGSGVRYYDLECGNLHNGPVMKEGGMFTTCFMDDRFLEEGFSYIQENFSIDWGPWGPEPNYIPPFGYSVRWHGWLMQEITGKVELFLEGKGDIKMILGDRMIMDWTDLAKKPTVKDIEMGSGEFVPVEIYYRPHTGISRISIRMVDTVGRESILGDEGVYYPSSDLKISDRSITKISSALTAIDWTGRNSNRVTIVEEVDRTPPEINLNEQTMWTGSKTATVQVTINDPDPEKQTTSGIDIGSIKYRIWEDHAPILDIWQREDLKITKDKVNPTKSVDLSLAVNGKDDRKFNVQFSASDLNGNNRISDIATIGFDLKPPEVSITGPFDGSRILEGDLNISIRAYDIGGSGVDQDSMEIHTRVQGESWGDWKKVISSDLEGEVRGFLSIDAPPSTMEIQARCSDRVGWEAVSDLVKVYVEEESENSPPAPFIASPLNGSISATGSIIHLDATGTYDDGLGQFDHVHLTWTSNISGVISNMGIDDVVLDTGFHRITLYADDGSPGHNVSTWVDIIVGVEKEEGLPGHPSPNIPETPREDRGIAWFIILLVVTLSVVATGIVIIVFRSKRESPPVSVENAPLDRPIVKGILSEKRK